MTKALEQDLKTLKTRKKHYPIYYKELFLIPHLKFQMKL